MLIKPLFDESEHITVQEYLKRKGVTNLGKYLKFNTLDNSGDRLLNYGPLSDLNLC